MIRHGLPYMHLAQAPWREAVTLVPRIVDTAIHNRNDACRHRPYCLIRANCRPHGPHGSPETSDGAIARTDTDPKSP